MKQWTQAVAFSCAVVFGAVVSVSAADNNLAAAKDLYASAAYEDALAMLTGLTEGDGVSVDVAVQVAEYRSFCLFALGRTTEAETVARDLIRKHPLLPLQDDEMSPRVDAMYSQVRRQVLPPLIREKYRAAKAALDRKEFAVAESDLQSIQKMIGQAEKLGVGDDSLTDLGLLAEGFLDLARAAARKADASAVAAAAPPAPAVAMAAAAAEQATARLYDASEEGIAPPVPVRQTVPPIPPGLAKLTSGRRGILEMTIEADGSVSGAVMRESIHVQYDTIVTRAARTWRYKPAVKNGVPVRYVKAVALNVME